MKLSDKIATLRKSRGMSQEELAEKLNVSRQAVSRWETGAAMPDAENTRQLSRLFQVTADYLLNDDYKSGEELPRTRGMKPDYRRQALILLVTMECMILLMQAMAAFLFQNDFFACLGVILFVALTGGFHAFAYTYQKQGGEPDERAVRYQKQFYKISVWLGSYFPIRFFMRILGGLYPRPYSVLLWECIVLGIYGMVSVAACLLIERYLVPGSHC